MSPDALPTALARVRSRARVARLAAVLPWALAAGAAAYAIGHLAGAGVAAPVLLGAAVALVALLGGLVAWGAWRPLTDARVARLADDRLGQRDLFSSAIEVSPAASVVAMALHLEAGRRSDQVRAADVVALRLPRGGTLALVVVLAAGALVQLWTAGRGPLSAGVSAEDAASVERVLELAEVTAAAAEARRDPHLAAVATALAELAEEAAARGERTIADVERLEGLVAALERLAMPAGSLGARSARAPGEDVPQGETMAGLEERLASMARLSGQGEAPTYDPETTWLEGDLVRQEPVLGDAPNLSRPPGAAAGEAPDGLDAAPSQADGDAESDIASAFIIGASSESAAGASSMAGQGTQDLFGEAAAVTPPGALETVTAQGVETEDGRRVSVELSPDAAEAQGSEEGFELTAWRPTGLPQVASSDLPFKFRTVAGGYFLPPQETVSR